VSLVLEIVRKTLEEEPAVVAIDSTKMLPISAPSASCATRCTT
jgi:hypothetical protein